jgi:hypothetical protein
MSWSGEKGMPGPPGIDQSDYELISAALTEYESNPSLTEYQLKRVYVTGLLVREVILWYEFKKKCDALDRRVQDDKGISQDKAEDRT